jgi:hypothetical protein
MGQVLLGFLEQDLENSNFCTFLSNIDISMIAH